MSLNKVLLAKKRTDLAVTPRYEEYLARTPNILLDDKISEFIVKELTTPQRDRRMTNSASSRGSCLRSQVFVWTGLPQARKLNSDLHAIFHDGTFRHLRWQALLLDARILTQVEVPCRIDSLHVTGTIDGIIGVASSGVSEPIGWELKGANDNNYNWVLQHGPMEKHLFQIHTYMLATGIRMWSLIYENKNTQEWKEFMVPFDQTVADIVADELLVVNKYVSDRRLPPVLEPCKMKQGPYRSCAFAHLCLDTKEWPTPPRRIRRP